MSEKPPVAAAADDRSAAPSLPPESKPAESKPAEAAAAESKTREAKATDSKAPEAEAAASKPLASEKPAAKAASERAPAAKREKSATSAAPKAPTPSSAPSQTRSAILPLGLATAGIAGLLLWLGSGSDEPPPLAPEVAVHAPAHLPGTPAIQGTAAEVKADEPAADTAGAATVATAAAEPSPAAEAAPSAEVAPSAETNEAEAAPGAAAPASAEPANAKPEASAEAPPAAEATAATEPAPSETPAPADSAGPIPSDEGLLEGPVTQVFMAPDCAELYRKGKRVGRSGVRVRVPEGQKRVYEVVCPGHNTRKLTLDGSRKEVNIGLRPVRR